MVELLGLSLYGGQRCQVLGQAAPLRHAPAVAHVEHDDLFGREPHGGRRRGAVDAGVEHRVELELDAEVLGHLLHLEHFVHVDGRADGLQLERQVPLQQEMNAAQAVVVRSGDARQPLVGRFRGAVEGDLDGEGAAGGQPVGDALVDERAVGEERDEEAALFGVAVDLQKISPPVKQRKRQPASAISSMSRQ